MNQQVKSCELFKGVCIEENKNSIDVAKLIKKFQERRIYVLNKKKFPVGIISLVDINDRVVAKGLDIKKTKAKDFMSYPLKLVVDVNSNLKEVATKMINLDIYYAPVIDGKGIFKGVLTYANLIKVLRRE
jgi:predicted transcriptional regulator